MSGSSNQCGEYASVGARLTALDGGVTPGQLQVEGSQVRRVRQHTAPPLLAALYDRFDNNSTLGLIEKAGL